MSFWSRLGDAADSVGEGVDGAFGAAWTAAKDGGGDVADFGKFLAKGPLTGLSQTASLLHKPYEALVARPVSTFAQVVGPAGSHNFFHPEGLGQEISTIGSADAWRKAWNQSADISPGQAIIGTSNGWLDKVDINDAKAREQYFHHTWSGRLSSGAIDFGLNVWADPLAIGAKGAKAAQIASVSVKPSEISGAVQFARGEANAAQVGKPAAKAGGKLLQNIVKGTDGKSTAELMNTPAFRQSSDPGTLAVLFGEANKITDETTRHAAKVDIFGAALGNASSITKLRTTQTELAAQMKRMLEVPETTTGATRFRWDDHGQGEIDFWGMPERTEEMLAHTDKIQAEIGRLTKLDNLAGTINRVGSTTPERFGQARADAGLRQSMIINGQGGRAIRVLHLTPGSRIPGEVNTKDVTQGYEDVRNIVRSAKWLTGENRAKYLNEFLQADSQGARNVVVQRLENHMFTAAGEKYGKTPAEMRTLYQQADGVRTKWRTALKSRVYSAAPDTAPVMIGPDGVANAYGPWIGSQLDSSVPITDPKHLDQILAREQNTRWLETHTLQRVMSTERAGRLQDGIERAFDVADSLARGAMNIWKFSALFTAKYPARIQVDTQLRNLAVLGPIQQFMSMTRGTLNIARNKLLSGVDDAGNSARLGKTAAKKSDLRRVEEFHGVGIQPARGDEDLAILERTLGEGGTTATLMSDATSRSLKEMRSSGNFQIVEPGDNNWGSAYLRDVNHQLRNSPTARAMLAEPSNSTAARLVRSDPSMRAEYANFKAQYATPEEWVGRIREEINHLLPDDVIRAKAAERPLREPDLAEHFGDVTKRMKVHGEQYTALNAKAAGVAALNKFREWWYQTASDAPERVMGRHPLYNQRFREHMKDQITRLGDDEAVDANRQMAMRRNADHLARRDVADTLFDLTRQSNGSETFRHFSPFFAAWEDTMKKWGQLFYDDPSIAVRFAQTYRSPNNFLSVIDSEGNRVDANGDTYDSKSGEKITGKSRPDYKGHGEYILLPKQMSPVPGGGQIRLDKNSFNIVFQGSTPYLPGLGPLVQVPTNEMMKKFFPTEVNNPVMKYILPFGIDDGDVLSQLEPGYVSALRSAFSQNSSDYANTYGLLMAQETVKFNTGARSTKPEPAEVAGMTRNWYILKAVLANASPVSASPTPKLQFYVDQAHEYRNKYGLKWQDQFYKDFPDYFEMSLSLSKSTTGIAATDKAYNESKKPYIKHEIAKNPEFGWLLVGPANDGGEFSQGVYSYQKTQAVGDGNTTHFRGQYSGVEAVEQIQSQKGWAAYQKYMTKLNLALEARGLHSFQQRGAEDLAEVKKQVTDILQQDNPSWAKDFAQQDSGKAVRALSVANSAIKKSPELAKRPDMVAIGSYLKYRAKIREVLASRESQSLDAQSNKDVAEVWGNITTILKQDNVGFEQFYNRVGRFDNLTEDVN